MIDITKYNPESDSIISPCGNYRYALWRNWDKTRVAAMFILLNPHVDGKGKNSPIVDKCIKYAKRWGYGGVIICNLYAYITDDLRELANVDNPHGLDNYQYISQMVKYSGIVVAGWGGLYPTINKLQEIRNLVGPLHYLQLDKMGIPKHPLTLSKSLKPLRFKLTQYTK